MPDACPPHQSSTGNSSSSNSNTIQSKTEPKMSADISLAQSNVCIGCSLPIQDQYFFQVLPNMKWHEDCLQCTKCELKLNENVTCFIMGGKPYCKDDYYRLFSVKCEKCGLSINKKELVLKSNNKPYHYDCFSCNVCNKKIQPGEDHQIVNDLIFCKDDSSLFTAGYGANPMPNQNYHFMHQFPNQTQLYLGNLNQYSSSSILTPESSIHSSNSLSPNTNSISSASTSSSIVDSPSNVSNSSLINNQNTNSYLFNQSALAAGNSKSNGISHQSYLVTDTNNHNTEDDNSISDNEDLDEDEENDDDEDNDDKSMISDENSLNESSNSNGLMMKKKKKFGLNKSKPYNGVESPSLLQINHPMQSHGFSHVQHHHHHMSHHGSSSSSKPARIRTVLNERQLQMLKNFYLANPRPDALMKEQLVEMTGLNPRVIRVWFQNKRCKDKKKNVSGRPEHSPMQLPHQFSLNNNNNSNSNIASHQHNLMFDNCY